jgi:hypothetical protein
VTITDLRIGDNLQNYIVTAGMIFTLEQPVFMVQIRFKNLTSILRCGLFYSGPLADSGDVKGFAWAKNKYAPVPAFTDVFSNKKKRF